MNNNGTKPNDDKKNEGAPGQPLHTNKSTFERNWRPLIGILIIVAIATVAIILVQRQKMKDDAEIGRLMGTNDELHKVLMQRDSLVNEWISAFEQIEGDLQIIKSKADLLTLKPGEEKISDTRKQDILEDIKLLNTLLEENKKRIAQLDRTLKNSGVKIASLEEKLMVLSAELRMKDSSVVELKNVLASRDFEINQLNEKVEVLDAEIGQHKAVIVLQENELNKAFVASGTFKELKEKGILNKTGGFIGLGKSKTLLPDVSEQKFNQVNIAETKTIPVNSKKVTLITEHPANSYELVTKDEMVASIEIKDPAQFWRLTKYAVIETVQ